MSQVIGSALIRIIPDMSKFGPGITAGASGPLGGMIGKLNKLSSAAGNAARATRGITLAVGLLGFAMYKSAEGFQTAMLEVKAVTEDSSKSIKENADQYAALEAAARKLGRTGLFSAEQAALGLSELTRAGYTAHQSIVLLPKVAAFASAAHMELGDSAKIVATQLHVYGMAAEEVGRVVDSMAESDFRSISSMEEISYAMAYAAPVAEKAGASFETLAASLGQMANAGFRGSMGGTALRAIYSKLLHPTAAANEIIKKLGITVFDAHGNMLPMVDILKQFEKSGLKAGDAMAIFGQRGGPGFLGFLKQGSAALVKLTKFNQLAGHEVETMGKKMNLTKSQGFSLKSSFLGIFETLSKLRINMDESTAVLGQYVKGGMNAKEASSSLTNALEATRTKGFAKLVGGIIDVNGNLVNTQGESMGLAEIMGILQSKGMTTTASFKAFGGSAKDLAILMQTNVDKTLKLTDANFKAGRSSDVAKIQMEGMKGSIKRLRGAFESLSISVFGGKNGVLSVFAGLADKIAGAVNAMGNASPELLKFGTIALVAAAAFSPLMYAIKFLITGFTGILTVISLLFTPMGVLAAAVAVVAGAFFFMWTNSRKLRESLMFLWAEVKLLISPSEKAHGATKNLSKALKGLSEWGRSAGNSFAYLVNSVSIALPGLLADLTPRIQDMVKAFQDMIPAIRSFLEGFGAGVVVVLRVALVLFKAAVVVLGGLAVALGAVSRWLGSQVGLVKALGVAFGVFLAAKVLGVGTAFSFLRNGSISSLNNIGGGVRGLGLGISNMGYKSGGVFDKLGTKIFDVGSKMPTNLGDKMFKGLAVGAAAATAGVSGYMAGMAKSTGEAALSMVASATSIAAGFAAGGPIGGAVATLTTVVGYFFGQAAKKARELQAAQDDLNKVSHSYVGILNDMGVNKFSTDSAKASAAVKLLYQEMDKNDANAVKLSDAFSYLGVNVSVASLAIGKGKGGVKDLNAEIARASSRRADIITKDSMEGVSKFGHLTGIAKESLMDLARQLAVKYDLAGIDLPAVAKGSKNLEEFTAGLKANGIEVGSATQLQKMYNDTLQANLNESPVAKYLRHMPKVARKAYDEQSALAKLQKLINDEQLNNRGGAIKFAEAYDTITASLSASKTAYNNWLNSIQGKALDLNSVKLQFFDLAKQIQDVMSDKTLPDVIRNGKVFELLGKGTEDLGAQIATFANESGGNMGIFNAKVAGLRKELITGLASAMGITEGKAAGLVDQMLKIPPKTTVKVIADTEGAMKGYGDLKANFLTMFGSLKVTDVKLTTGDAKSKITELKKIINEYVETHPKAIADLKLDKVEAKDKLLRSSMASLGLVEANPKVDITTGSAQTKMSKLQSSVFAYINSHANIKADIQTAKPKERMAELTRVIADYAKLNPKAVAGLDLGNTKVQKEIYDGWIKSLKKDVKSTATLTVETKVKRPTGWMGILNMSKKNWDVIQYEKAAKKDFNGDGVIGFGAEGGVFKKATNMIIGEAGAEVLIPLTDPARAAELAKQSGLMDVLSKAPGMTPALPLGVGAPIPADFTAVASTGTTGGVGADGATAITAAGSATEKVGGWFTSFAPQAASALTGFGATVWTAAAPGFKFLADSIIGVFTVMNTTLMGIFALFQALIVAWPRSVWAAANSNFSDLSTNIVTSFTTTAKSVVGIYKAMVADLTQISDVGGTGVVTSLSATLSKGTTAVSTIVNSYASGLVGALNPILTGIGSKVITLKAHSQGDINDPRIVKDGSYETHVFGERGTHGEAYIPFNPALKERSRAIAEKTVERLGGVAHFAKGGISEDDRGWNWKTMGNHRASRPIMDAFRNGLIGDLNHSGRISNKEWSGWSRFKAAVSKDPVNAARLFGGAKHPSAPKHSAEGYRGWNWKTMGNHRATRPIMDAFPNGLIGDLNHSGRISNKEWSDWTRLARELRFAKVRELALGGFEHPRIQHFAKGGITGDTEGLNPGFRQRLDLWSSAVGSTYNIKSGYRSIAEQADLFKKWLNGTGNLAAAPGHSMHNFGLAADGPHWKDKNPGAFGLNYAVPTEGWHVEPFGAKGKANFMPDSGWANMKPLPMVPSGGTKGVISDVAGALMGYGHDAAVGFAGRITGDAPSGSLAALPVQMQHILATIRSLESGSASGNYTAKSKDSSASGAYQFTDGTWGRYGGYAKAMLAPAQMQDSKATSNVQSILNRHQNNLEAVPAAWYTGGYRGHGKLNYRPEGPGNPLTVQQYVDQWLGIYAKIPGFANGAIFDKATLGVVGEAGREVLLPMKDPTRALQLAMRSGLMDVLDTERARTQRAAVSSDTDGGFLGGTGNNYTITGITLDQVRAEIKAHDKATSQGRR